MLGFVCSFNFLKRSGLSILLIIIIESISIFIFKAYSHQAKAQIFFEVCQLFFHIFRFRVNIPLVWIGPRMLEPYPLYWWELIFLQIAAMNEDFEKLRQHVWDSGLMKTNPWFYIAHFCKYPKLPMINTQQWGSQILFFRNPGLFQKVLHS